MSCGAVGLCFHGSKPFFFSCEIIQATFWDSSIHCIRSGLSFRVDLEVGIFTSALVVLEIVT